MVHTGTNNLKAENVMTVTNKLLTLKDNIKQNHLNTAVKLSTLALRTDDRSLEQKVRDVNDLLTISGIDIVNNDNFRHVMALVSNTPGNELKKCKYLS